MLCVDTPTGTQYLQGGLITFAPAPDGLWIVKEGATTRCREKLYAMLAILATVIPSTSRLPILKIAPATSMPVGNLVCAMFPMVGMPQNF